MSDNTPESAEYDELPEEVTEDQLAADDDVRTDDVDASDSDLADEELDLQLDEPVAAAAAVSGVRRKTSKAPVRKKDLDPDLASDDAAIATLESDLTEGERNAGALIDRKTAKAPQKKTDKAKKRSESHDPYKAHNPAEFVNQSVAELKRVVWPTWPELVQYFLAVLVFVLFFIAFIGLLDVLFGWSLLTIFGDKG